MNPYENQQDYTNGQEPEYVDTNRVTSPDQKKNVAVAAGGTTLLAASAIGLGMMEDGDSVSSEELSDATAYDNNANANAIEPPLIVPVSNTGGVKSMSDLDNLDTFDKAFAAARHLVGPGHYFTWHGNTYNTYYTEELDALSPDARQSFLASLDIPAGQREVTPMPAHQEHAPQLHHSHAEPMLASHVEVEPVPAHDSNTPEIVPIAATVGAATAYTEITPVLADASEHEHTGMGPHIDSHDEYMGHPQIVGHDDATNYYDQNHDQLNSHDVGLHLAE